MELLRKLYKVYSPSGKERAMIALYGIIPRELPVPKVETDAAGNLYITKGEAESYPCIVAHLDQVQRLHSKISCLLKREKSYSVTAPGIKDRKDSEPMTKMESG